jgi:GAF domain-containing protein
MRRRSRAASKPVKSRGHQASGQKPGKARTRRASTAELQQQLDRRTRELNEALEQQVATSEVLSIIRRSPADPQPVFDAIVQSGARLCDAIFSVLYLCDDDHLRIAATKNYSPEATSISELQQLNRPDRSSLGGRAILDRAIVHVSDVLADPEYSRELALAGGWRAVLAVPLLRDAKAVGSLNVAKTEPTPFSDRQIQLLKTFADQALIAIENVRLLNELRDSLQQQTATADVLKAISRSTFDLQTVLDTLAESVTRLCEASYAWLFQRDGDLLHFLAGFGHATDVYAQLKDRFNRREVRVDRGSIIGRAVLEGRTIHVSDVLADAAYAYSDIQKIGGYRAALSAPLLRDGNVVGALFVTKPVPQPFTEEQIELVTTFADQAVIAIENTRLLNELRESLEQQTATSEVLKVIGSSPGELIPVFDSVLANATRICEASLGVILLCERDDFCTAAICGELPAAFMEQWQRGVLVRRNPDLPAHQAAVTRQPVQIADLRTTPAYLAGVPLTVSAADVAGIRTLLIVPMIKENDAVGVIAIYRQEIRPFSDKQIELLKNFAAQAVIAIENARLLNELRTRTNELAQSVGELRALGEVTQAVNSTLDLETVLTTIVGQAVQLSHTDAGAIYVFDEERKEFHLHATYGMSEALIAAISGRRIGLNDANIGAAATGRKPIQVPDIRDQPSPLNEIVMREGYRGILIVPLLRPDYIVGALVVRRKTPGEFPQSTIDLLQTFADQSVVAIQNARLYENVEARTRELAASLEDLRTTQDRLVQTEKLASLGQLTAGIAHEIKNPLNFVNNFSAVSVEMIDELQETLGHIKADDKTLAEINELTNTLRGNLDKVVQHGKRADAIVKNMLMHSREGSGERRPVNINALVEESLNLAYHGARAEKQGFNITLERSLDPAAGEVDIFPQDMTRVLLNLISNGFYAATKRKAQVDVGYEPTLMATTKNLGDSVEIRIRDNGTGIPPEVKEQMFNPFFTTKPAGEGTGLGLSISHDIIVKQHGGSIEVDTEPGEFTEIKIILPRAAALLPERS